MIIRAIWGSSAAVVLAILSGGCTTNMMQTAYSPMPSYCSRNNTAAGAIIGSAIGAAIGAAAGRGRGAAIGAAAGGGLGLATGAQADTKCRQLAAQKAMEAALAQREAAIARAAQMQQPASLAVVGGSIPYVASNGHHHRVQITQIQSYAEPATDRVCSSGVGVDNDTDGTTNASIPVRMCRGPDGKWNPA
jgi:uncharacterized membrane protein